jgi:hypothetical protein
LSKPCFMRRTRVRLLLSTAEQEMNSSLSACCLIGMQVALSALCGCSLLLLVAVGCHLLVDRVC